jgi:2-oxo-3-hexenedioate decarboxylase
MRRVDAQTLEAIAAELDAAEREARVIAPLAARYPGFDLDAAYAAAARVHALRRTRGRTPRGRKIGFTNRSIWPLYGVDGPMWAYVYADTVIEARDGCATVPLAGLVQPRIEPEICLRVRGPVPVTDDPAAVLAACDAYCHSIEIVQCHFPDWHFALPDAAADSALHGRLVVGRWRAILGADVDALADTLRDARVTLSQGARQVAEGRGANALDHPASALGFLAEVLSRRAGAPPLAPGEIVSTGTLTDAYPVAPGETWSTRWSTNAFDGLAVDFV